MIYLVVYDTGSAKLVSIDEFDDSCRNQAMDALRTTQESMFSDLGRVEVGLFEAESRATLEHTHSRYFKSLKQLNDDLSEAITKRSA